MGEQLGGIIVECLNVIFLVFLFIYFIRKLWKRERRQIDVKRKKSKGYVLLLLMLADIILFSLPLAYTYILSHSDGSNMWSENGHGAILWVYLFLLPFCGITFIILLVKYLARFFTNDKGHKVGNVKE